MKYLIIIILLPLCYTLNAQNDNGLAEYMDFWAFTDSLFFDAEFSPLKDEQKKDLDSVPRFQFDENFRVEARWTQIEGEESFYFETTGKIKQEYLKVGLASFKINDQDCELSIYKNIELSKSDGYEDYLFVPFTDLSNGEETYGGGRYLSLHAEPKESIVLDFNQAYNPYCAYNDRYSCPIPPRENSLQVSILAGALYNSKH